MLPRFEIVARRRPVRMVVPGSRLPAVAPYVAVRADIVGPGPVWLTLASQSDVLSVELDDSVTLRVTTGATTTRHRSRRHGRHGGEARGLALALTGPQVTAFTREHGRWVVRARFDLTNRLDPHDESWLAGLVATSSGPVDNVDSGRFGQLGLRDLRLVSNADGTAYDDNGLILLTASSAGPGFFPTGHTSVWALYPETFELEHRADLFFRRPDRAGVFGDHSSHLLCDGDRWLVATSTWGDFDQRRPGIGVAATIASSAADLLAGQHVLDTRPLVLPTSGLPSVGVYDPHLVRSGAGPGGEWLVGYVNATRFFRFHPVLARGRDLDSLTRHATAADRRATEGPTLVRLGETWRLLASDGRDGRRGQRAAFPVFDLDLQQVGALDAAYPTNLPWPTLVRRGDAWLMVGFNGAPYGGPLVGYGSHGQVVVQRAVASPH